MLTRENVAKVQEQVQQRLNPPSVDVAVRRNNLIWFETSGVSSCQEFRGFNKKIPILAFSAKAEGGGFIFPPISAAFLDGEL